MWLAGAGRNARISWETFGFHIDSPMWEFEPGRATATAGSITQTAVVAVTVQ